MAHFAKINDNNIVEYVTYLDNEILLDENNVEQESLGLNHILSTIPEADQYTWKQCSYNCSFRGKYPALGDLYLPELDAFISPKPCESWILDETNIMWVPPFPSPELSEDQIKQGYSYIWYEKIQNYVLMPVQPLLTPLERENNKTYQFNLDTAEWELIDL